MRRLRNDRKAWPAKDDVRSQPAATLPAADRARLWFALTCGFLFAVLYKTLEICSRVSSVVERIRLHETAEGLSFLIAFGWCRSLILDPFYLRRSPYMRPIAEWIGERAFLGLFLVLAVILAINISIRLWRGVLYRLYALRKGWASVVPPPLSRSGCVTVFALRIVGYLGSGFTWLFLWDLNTAAARYAGARTASPNQELWVGVAVVCSLCVYNACDRFARDWQRAVETWQQSRGTTVRV